MKNILNLFLILLPALAYSQTKNINIAGIGSSFHETKETFPKTEYGEKRLALLIGMANYKNYSSLPNDINDIDDVTYELNKLGFDVFRVIDLEKHEVDKLVNDVRLFYKQNGYNIGLFFYSGHGATIGGGLNLLLPVDMPPLTKNLSKDTTNSKMLKKITDAAFTVTDITWAFDHEQTKCCISIIDACRNYNYIVEKGASMPNIPDEVSDMLRIAEEKKEMDGKATMLVSSKSGQIASSNSPNGRNSLFTFHFLEWLKFSKSNLSAANTYITLKLMGKQTPILSPSSYYPFEFYKTGNASDTDLPISSPKTNQKEDQNNEGTTYTSPAKKDDFLLKNDIPNPIKDLINNMVFVEGGHFIKAPYYIPPQSDIPGGGDVEFGKTDQRVNSFYISKFELTNEQWFSIVNINSKYIKKDSNCGKCPIGFIGISELDSFIQTLNRLTGLKFRLPTHIEWEYAAKGGKYTKGWKYSGGNKLEEVSWNFLNSNDEEHPVGQKAPNELGIYDMSGNVYELTTLFSPSLGKVWFFKGGCFFSTSPGFPRKMQLEYYEPSDYIKQGYGSWFSGHGYGFRLVLDK